jgi:hypothetical protein
MNMKPGRKLDALVAEKVMGYHNIYVAHDGVPHLLPIPNSGTTGVICPRYSTDIAAAWEVVEKLQLLNKPQSIPSSNYAEHLQLWQYDETKWMVGNIESDTIYGEGESVAHAICLAALKIVGREGI